MNKSLILMLLGVTLILAGVVCYYSRSADGWVMYLFLYGGCSVVVGLLCASWDVISEMISGIFSGGDKTFHGHMTPQKPVNSPSDELRNVVADLRKQVDRLSGQVDGLGRVVSSAELEVKVSSLQKVLVTSQSELKLAKDSLAAERKSLEAAQAEIDDQRKVILGLRGEQERLGAALRSATNSYDKLISDETDRLSRMVPAGLLDSPICMTIRWSAEASARGDRLGAQIFASLQSIKAAQEDEALKGLLLSSLQVLGQSLTRLSEREGYSPEQKYDVLSNWSSVLNEISASRFTLIVPSIGARLNLNTMVSSGPAGGNVSVVHCWGVMNENRDLYSPASVS